MTSLYVHLNCFCKHSALQSQKFKLNWRNFIYNSLFIVKDRFYLEKSHSPLNVLIHYDFTPIQECVCTSARRACDPETLTTGRNRCWLLKYFALLKSSIVSRCWYIQEVPDFINNEFGKSLHHSLILQIFWKSQHLLQVFYTQSIIQF